MDTLYKIIKNIDILYTAWIADDESITDSCTKTAHEDISMGIRSTPKIFGGVRDLYEDPKKK